MHKSLVECLLFSYLRASERFFIISKQQKLTMTLELETMGHIMFGKLRKLLCLLNGPMFQSSLKRPRLSHDRIS